MNQKLKSTLAVLAGLVVIFVLSSVVDAIMEWAGVFPSMSKQAANPALFVSWMAAIALAYRIIISVFGCYIAAKLAPQNPRKHAMILGYIGVVLSLLGTIAMWSRPPHWYPISLIIISIPCAWLGGKLATRK